MKAYRIYTNANVTTASAPRIMMTLFETALRHMRAGKAAYAMGDYRNGGDAAEKAAAIVLGLQATLKHEIAPSLCEQLDAVYGFVVARLTLAIGAMSPQYMEEAERVFLPIVEAFDQAVASEATVPAVAAGGTGR
ncbi:MAG TPA: flagellar export chaperone FliS [Polyangia bacterium]|jgi:Flagellin-specific chaperone FliS|nr:flagellar export chaperone FliS [Polyangia bacterium]